MTQPSDSAEQLRALLELDYRPADLGDDEMAYTNRMQHIVTAALARPVETTEAQREAGARYLLTGAVIRQTRRLAEEQKNAAGSSIRQDLASKLASLQAEQAQYLRASGLAAEAGLSSRQRSVSVSVELGF